MKPLLFVKACTTAILALEAVCISAATLTVTVAIDSVPGAAGSLRGAIASASPSDTIEFASNLSVIDVTYGDMSIGKNITIKGPGASKLAIRSTRFVGSPRVFRIFNNATVVISGVTISNGSSAGVPGGGGVLNESGSTLTVSDAVIDGCQASVFGTASGGGGLWNAGTATVVRTTISNNSTADNNGAGASGGGIFNAGTLSIVNSTISSNSADGGHGKGIFNSGTLTMNGSTIAENTAGTAAGGGLATNGGVTITNSTIARNSAISNGGGIEVLSGLVSMRNTIVARNMAASGPDIKGAARSEGYVLLGDNTNVAMTEAAPNTDKIGSAVAALDPVLGPLQDNGGPTKTMALLSGSPAIEAGFAGGSNTDQRGAARPVDSPVIANAFGGDGSDIGAYEVQADVLPGCNNVNRVVANGGDSGIDSLRDVVSKVCAGSTITFAPGVSAVTLTASELGIDKSLTIAGPGARLLTVQRSAAGGTPNFRVFRIGANVNVGISGLSISNGKLQAQNGGGVLNAATLLLDSVTVSDNSATLTGNGGGIYSSGILTLSRSTVSGNTVSSAIGAGSGGGIYNFGGTLNVANSTISGNSAIGPGGNSDSGGGIITNAGVVNLSGSTITGNSGDIGGGIRNVSGATVNMRSTIVALNTSPVGPDINGPITSQGYNVIGDVSGGTVSPTVFSDQIGVSAAQLALGALQDNGGPTRTHALLTGSVAIDKGDGGSAATDQRGFARSIDIAGIANAGDGADVGAFEFGGGILDVDGNNAYDALTDGLLVIRYLFDLSGPSLTAGAVGPSATRTTPEDIKQFLDANRQGLDIDGNTQVDALTDGLLVIRYLFGLRGVVLSANAVGSGATRTPQQIETYLQSLVP